MTPVEIIALIVIIGATIKIIMLLVNPKSWMNFAKRIYSSPGLVSIIGFILAGIVLYYLLGAGITIVEILAVTALVGLLIVIGLAPEVESLMKKYQAQIKKGTLWKDYWLYTILWIILLVWGAKELFF